MTLPRYIFSAILCEKPVWPHTPDALMPEQNNGAAGGWNGGKHLNEKGGKAWFFLKKHLNPSATLTAIHLLKQTYMKTMFLLYAFLITASTGFAQSGEKRLIDTAEVNYVEFVKVNFTEPAKSEKRLLTQKQYAEFAYRWNASKPLGADKYKMKYYVYVVLKSGSKRRFTISGSSIQEQDWTTYDVGDKLYFDKLWEAVK